MQNILVVLHLIVVLALVIVVLLQRSEGGLGLGGGSSSSVTGFMTGRGQANALTRATTILGAAFFILSLALAVSANMSRQPASILDTAPASSPSAPVSGTPGTASPTNEPNLLEDLRRMQGERPAQSGPLDSQPTPAQPQAPTSR